MGLPQIVDQARQFAVMVGVQGPDPKGVKMKNHAFHRYNSGRTTLQASGMLLPCDAQVAKGLLDCNNGAFMLVITMASVVEPFLSTSSQGRPELISDARIAVMVEVMNRGTGWVKAQLLKLVNVPASAVAFRSLAEAYSGSIEHEWEVGWSLASNGNDAELSMATIAILGLPSLSKDLPKIITAVSHRRGDLLFAVGSPFGVLSPSHFFNSISVGCIANSFPLKKPLGLLIADIRCLPGMEGGPVFGEHGHLIGILSIPLKHKTTNAEIQLVIPWEAIASACSDLLQNTEKMIVSSHSPVKVEEAMASVCLIITDDGVRGSGVLLNKQGLILTNAHLLEPWRLEKTSISGGRSRTESENLALQKSGNSSSSLADDDELGMFNKGRSRNTWVRLGHVEPWLWRRAKTEHVCKEPLDVALLKLDNVPKQLSPISADPAAPSVGSKAYVIGHGLLGPKRGISASVCSGVVAKVVEVEMPISHEPFFAKGTQNLPVMLETTAAVHGGASGGAVVNSNGQLIGLITGNATHEKETIIPHLNFSLPCAALAPILSFSKDMKNVSLPRVLDQPNKQLHAVWAFVSSPSEKLGPAREECGKKEAECSRFAKVIAEQQEAPKSPVKLSKL